MAMRHILLLTSKWQMFLNGLRYAPRGEEEPTS